MDESSFEIRFSGVVAKGEDIARVKQRMAALFKTDMARIERLFSGASVVLKRGLTPAEALKYRTVLRKIGAVAEMREEPAPVTAPAAPAVPAATAPDGDLSLAEPGVTLVESAPTPEPAIDISSLSAAAPGIDLVVHAPVAEPDIDISALSAAPPGADLGVAEPRPAAEIDTSTLSLAAPGARLAEPSPKPRIEIDTSGLSTH